MSSREACKVCSLAHDPISLSQGECAACLRLDLDTLHNNHDHRINAYERLRPKMDDAAFPAFDRGQSRGMNLRDWFAGHALAGMLGNSADSYAPEDAARIAYLNADAMLAKRESAGAAGAFAELLAKWAEGLDGCPECHTQNLHDADCAAADLAGIKERG